MSQVMMMRLQNCGCCKMYEAKPQIPGMELILCMEPMELIHIDYGGMEVMVATNKKPVVKNVLVVIDHFTWFVHVYITRNQTAHTTVQVLYNEYFSIFGFPWRLMSDQGKALAGKVIQALCILLGIKKIRITPYHPQTNGLAERVHQTLQRMIGKLDPEWRQKWPAHIGSMIIAYNATHSLVTSYSPYFLMFGSHPQLPIDLLFPMQQGWGQTQTIDKYVETLYDQLKESLQIAQDFALKEAQQQKCCYDQKVGAIELRLGDCILVKLDAFVGQCRKLKNWWGDTLHTVVGHMVDGIPMYVMKNNQTRKMKLLHRARLLLWLANYG